MRCAYASQLPKTITTAKLSLVADYLPEPIVNFTQRKACSILLMQHLQSARKFLAKHCFMCYLISLLEWL